MASGAAHFLDLFAYNADSNQRLGKFLREENVLSERVVSIYSHLLNAQLIWNSRILGAPEIFGVWEKHEPEKWSDIDDQNLEMSRHIIETLSMGKVVRYSNSKGEVFRNTVEDILFHVINHATHHRGQLSVWIREARITPPTMDYIFYKRQKQ